MRGQFYKSDLEAAVTLSTSIDTVRWARRQLKKLEWVSGKSGFLEKGKRPVATTFFNVAFSQVLDGKFFAPIHRYAFEALLYKLRKGILGHKEVLLFCYVCFFDAKYREEKDFFISKRELMDITGMTEAPMVLLKLNENEIFGKGETLFEIVDVYHKVKILKHRGFADPEEDEHNRGLAYEYKQDIRQRVEAAKKEEAKQRGESQKEDLVPLFKKLYKKTHGRAFVPGYDQERRLESMAEKYGSDVVVRAIEEYFHADIVPNVTGGKTRTLANFLECHEEFIAC